MCFGGDPGDGQKKAAADLQAQRDANRTALAGYNARANPFFGLAQSRGEFGQSFFPDFAQEVRNPELSPTFGLLAKEGLNIARNNNAVTGSPSSGPGQIMYGRMMAGLGGHVIDNRNQMLLAGMQQQGQLPHTQEPDYLGMNSQLSQGIAKAHTADAQGGNGGWGGLFGNLAGTFVGSYPWG